MATTGVLFMQSQEWFGPDSQLHASLMRHLDRTRFDVHCAVPADVRGQRSAPSTAIREIADVHVRPTHFGPSFDAPSRRDVLRSAATRGIPACWSLPSLIWYVRRNNISIVHCTEKPRDAIFGSIIARLGGARCVIHVHVKAEGWIRRGVRKAMQRADALIAISEFVAESIREMGYDASRVHTVLNGLELDEWIDVDADVEAVRAEFDIPPAAPVLMSASRLFRYKGQHELLAAVPAVREQVPDVKVLIVGTDDTRGYEGENYSETLRRMCAELEIEDAVVFTGWRSDIPALMSACDLYVMPSYEEPFGMVFVEAMYLGKPVIALDNGGTREVVVNGETGLLSDSGDTPTLAEHIVRLLTDDALRASMGERGHRRVAEVLNSVQMTRRVEAVYEALIAEDG